MSMEDTDIGVHEAMVNPNKEGTGVLIILQV